MREIVRAEQQITRLKSEYRTANQELRTARPSKQVANDLRVRMSRLLSRTEQFRWLIYIWRCFGDGIAFLYLDKHAIKHAYFRTDSTDRKEQSGFVSGKSGLAAEVALVEQGASQRIPSLLTDLTNTLRHGDVCVLVGPDPILIEAKSGARLGKRGRKQEAAIETLHKFFETDMARNFRGLPEVRRVAHPLPEVTHVSVMNRCIEKARKHGADVANPENGLYYIALYDGTSLSDLLGTLALTRPWVFPLNVAKSNYAWSPYTPFTLTIESTDHLYDFVRGDLYLVVVVDVDVLCRASSGPAIRSFGSTRTITP